MPAPAERAPARGVPWQIWVHNWMIGHQDQPGALIIFPELFRQLDFTTHLPAQFSSPWLTSDFLPHTVVQHTPHHNIGSLLRLPPSHSTAHPPHHNIAPSHSHKTRISYIPRTHTQANLSSETGKYCTYILLHHAFCTWAVGFCTRLELLSQT